MVAACLFTCGRDAEHPICFKTFVYFKSVNSFLVLYSCSPAIKQKRINHGTKQLNKSYMVIWFARFFWSLCV